jgi:phenylpropionate dioxygenase-like ring-hydroxylating dioxygenase large terminal subunit
MADNKNVELRPGETRCPGPNYQDILDEDTRNVPESYRADVWQFLGDDPLSVGRYTSPEFFEKEVTKMWSRVWQMACREEEIPDVGDYHVYENVGYSLLVVRTEEDKIQAFHNVCLHRGRKLATHDGCANQFRCPFHGFTWALNGEFTENPFPWDFPHLKNEDMSLPEAKVGRWGGFVFINFDENCKPLESVLGVIPEHFAKYNLQNCYKGLHVAKVVDVNWKALSEAFMESHHSVDTHPQLLTNLGCANSQYDIFSDHVTRQTSPGAVVSPHLYGQNISEQTILDDMFGRREDGDMIVKLEEGQKARAMAAEIMRQQAGERDGNDYSQASDAEMLDPMLYNIFPNISIWSGYYINLVYRWRPYKNDPNRGIMEVMKILPAPKEGPTPDPVPCHWLGEDEPWTAAEELGPLAAVFEQDMANLPYVQEGMLASARGGNGKIQLANYQEMRIRQHHVTLDKYINDEI